jgi:hypothetical protein
LVRRHQLLRGEIDAEIIILMVVSVFVLFGVAHGFSNGSQPNQDGPFALPCGCARHGLPVSIDTASNNAKAK